MKARGVCMETLNKIDKLANWLKNSKFCVALTGAGVSVPSGIPDFRSSNGVYAKYGQEIFDIDTFNSAPEKFYEFARKELLKMLSANPNRFHKFFAELEKIGLLKGIITQNIDNLHKKAGNQNVAEIHGSVRTWTCLKCFKRYDLLYEKDINEILTNNFKCYCGGYTKPDIVFFGEMLPLTEFSKAENWAKKSDLFITIGTSLAVYPAAQLPATARSSDAKLVIINKTATPFDKIANLKIDMDVIDFAENLAKALLL